MSRKTLFDAIITPIQVSELRQQIQMESVVNKMIILTSKYSIVK